MDFLVDTHTKFRRDEVPTDTDKGTRLFDI
jgi:hypothetical protein